MRSSTHAPFALAVLSCALAAIALLPARASAAGQGKDYIIVYQSAAVVNRAMIAARGHQVKSDLGKAGVMVVTSTSRSDLQSMPGVLAVAQDRPRIRIPREPITQSSPAAVTLAGCASETKSCDLQWDLDRINVPEAWRKTRGSRDVRVAVLDTGLRSTHAEVGENYDRNSSRSFVEPNAFCPEDAGTFASTEDFNGHGTWTGLHIAGRNGPFMTGIAPRTTLINVRVLGACGIGLDSWILEGLLYANAAGARIVNMSLGGLLCADGIVKKSYYCGTAENVGDDPAAWEAWLKVVQYLEANGTLVITSAGNDHVQLGRKGRVTSVGSLAFNSLQPDPANDLRGTAVVPGGLPGVVAVAATDRVNPPLSPGATYGTYGPERRDQLAYYSNYGEGVELSAPGGTIVYNVPSFDCVYAGCSRLSTSAPEATDNPGAFGAWATCGDDCYAFAQGTSMAAPQVAGVAALALAARPRLTPAMLRSLLLESVTPFLDPNATPPIAAEPGNAWFNFDVNYEAPGIPNSLMGKGVIDAAKAVQ